MQLEEGENFVPPAGVIASTMEPPTPTDERADGSVVHESGNKIENGLEASN
jgi:hypothetical protein